MNSKSENHEIYDLLIRLLDGDLQDCQRDRLIEWSRNHPDAVDMYHDFLRDYSIISNEISSRVEYEYGASTDTQFDRALWADLAEAERTAPALVIEKPKEDPKLPLKKVSVEKTPIRVSRLSLFTAISGIAAMLIAGVLVYLNTRTSPPLVARVVHSVNAEWQQGGESITLGEYGDLRTLSYTLQRGVAEIKLNDGARVVLEAPVEFKLTSTNSLFLDKGKLVATVGPQAFGFTVDTPTAKYVDLGTEFGVEVKGTGASEVHVFKGEVALHAGSDQAKISVLQGQARQVNAAGSVEAIPYQEARFVDRTECEARAKAQQSNGYHRWLAYTYQIHRDPGLVAHYTFNQDAQDAGKLINIAPATQNRLAGSLGLDNEPQTQPTWTQGRWPQKGALAFDRSKRQVVIVPDDTALRIAGDITISAWVKCPDITKGGGGNIVLSRTKDTINYMTAYGYRFSGKVYQSLNFLRYGEYLSQLPIRSNEIHPAPNCWHHVVVTHDNKVIRYYVDGGVVDTKAYEFVAAPVQAELQIGGAENYSEDPVPYFEMFKGIMDAIRIFNRVLSGEEIQNMYNSTKP